MGWFVPTSVVDSMWKKNKIAVDHWKAFEKLNIAKRFSWWGKEKLHATKPDYQSHAYLNKICQKNPNQKHRNCATLFASYLGKLYNLFAYIIVFFFFKITLQLKIIIVIQKSIVKQ